MRLTNFAMLMTCCTAIANNTFAANFYQPVLSFSAGPAWHSAGQTQNIYVQSDVQKTYNADKKNNMFGNFELFYGIQSNLYNSIWVQLGLAGAATTDTRLQGTIWEDADPQFDNYNYTYKINHLDLGLKAKMLLETPYLITPYLSVKVGKGFNRSHSFRIVSKIFEEVPAPGFEAYTKATYTYAVGLGVQRTILQNMQLGVGYQFSDWGNSRLNSAPNQTINTGLKLNHLYANSLQISVNYLI